MSDPIFLIQAEDLSKITIPPANPIDGYTFKGVILFPSTEGDLPIFYLNPVYEKHGEPGITYPDIIYQNNKEKACPYPPGYGIAGNKIQ